MKNDSTAYRGTIMSIWRWPHGIEQVDERCRIRLGEGDTPLI